MVLEDGVEVGRVAGEAGEGGEVLAGVVAFGGAGPEEETVVEGDGGAVGTAVGGYAVLCFG